MKNSGRTIKIIAIFTFLSLTLSEVLAYSTPAQGYEGSIYNSAPLLMWVFVVLTFVGGMNIIITLLSINEEKSAKMLALGMVALLSAKAFLLIMPYIRGYEGWTGDHMSHIGLIKEIIANGHFDQFNAYPMTHLFSSEFLLITNADLLTVNLLTPLLSVLFVLFIYLLATTILKHPGQQIIAALMAAVILLGGGYNVYLMPNGWSIFLLPLIFYLYFRSYALLFRGLFIFFLVICTLFHPLTALILISSLISMRLIDFLLAHPLKWNLKSIRITSQRITSFVLLGLISFLPWVLSFQQFKINLRVMWAQVITGFSSNPIDNIGGSLDKINVHGLDFILLFVKMYGAATILIFFSLVGIYMLMRKARTTEVRSMEYNYMSLAGLFLISSMLYVGYLIGIPGLGALAGDRIIFYAEVMTPLLAAPVVYWAVKHHGRYNEHTFAAIFIILLLASTASIVSLFPSPEIYRPNGQVTDADLNGSVWFLEKKDNSTYGYILSPPARLFSAILGHMAADERSDLKSVTQLTDHFGYYSNNTLTDQLSNDAYIITSEVDREAYTTVWLEVGRFTTSDFTRLDLDNDVSRIYTNGGIDVHQFHI